MKIGGSATYYRGRFVIIEENEVVTAEDVWHYARGCGVIYAGEQHEQRVNVKLPGINMQHLTKAMLEEELDDFYNPKKSRISA